MKLEKIIVLLLLVMVSATSFAAPRRNSSNTNRNLELQAKSSFHLGVSGGSMNTDIPNLSATSVAWSVLAGAEINRFMAVEVNYTNLGRTALGLTNQGVFSFLKGTTYSLGFVGKVPVTHAVSMFAKLGFANTDVYVEAAGLAGTTYSKTSPTIGLGVQAGLSKRFDVRIAYDNYKFTPDKITTRNADITSVGLIYKF